MIKVNGSLIDINTIPNTIFPDGTLLIHIENLPLDGKAEIEWLYEKDEEMMLYFIAKHLRANGIKTVYLYMPYIPNARLDRVQNKHRVFTLKYFCEFINSMNFDKVVVRDPHSYVSTALLNNVETEDISGTLNNLTKVLLNPEKDIVFYPDEGSCKRYSELIKFPCAFGIKNRNWRSGKIESLNVQGGLPDAPFNALIIDDISSYGGTFLHSARKLKELGADKVYLYVTHCENSILKGELINSGLLENIYTTKSIFTKQHDLIEILEVDENEQY